LLRFFFNETIKLISLQESCFSLIQFTTSHHILSRCILILSFRCLSQLVSSGFPTKILCAFLSPTMYAQRPVLRDVLSLTSLVMLVKSIFCLVKNADV